MTTLFIFAHPDDEAYGPAGTIARLSNKTEVIVVSLAKGDRPGTEYVSESRKSNFIKSCDLLGAKSIIFDYSDCKLNYDDTLVEIEKLIKEIRPNTVYTHNISDIHRDHRLVAECVTVACRPKSNSSVRELYFCETPSSTAWSFGKIEPIFSPNTYIDITDFIDRKKRALELYTTEIHKFPDARSVEATEALAKYRGYQSGFNFAEAFQLIFSLHHNK